MAIFELAIEKVLEHEGSSFTDDPVDPGGPTRWGITLSTLRRVRPRATRTDVIGLSREGACEVFRALYWDRLHLDLVVNQALAAKIFDVCVNLGVAGGVKLLQRALRCLEYPCDEDGVMGPVTLEGVNVVEPRDLLIEIWAEQDHHYRELIARNPALAKFAAGWKRRALWPLPYTPKEVVA